MGGGEQVELPGLVKGQHEAYANADEMRAASLAFFDGVEKLRKELGVQNYLLVTLTQAKMDGDVSSGFRYGMFGDQALGEVMAAYGLGCAKRDRERIVLDMMKSGLKD